VAVLARAEQDHPPLAGLLGALRFVYRRQDRVRRLRGRQDPLGARELHRRA
jgi:hypothetical protein